MIVVSDTTPPRYLILIEATHVLPARDAGAGPALAPAHRTVLLEFQQFPCVSPFVPIETAALVRSSRIYEWDSLFR
jgi:hypothetical protein